MFPFQIGSRYSFDTLAPAILGTRLQNMKVVGLIDYQSAIREANIEVLHRQIYPYLPAGTPDNPKQYIYLLLSNLDNQRSVLAYPWINESTITLEQSRTLIITVHNALVGDELKIRDNLSLLGFSFTIE